MQKIEGWLRISMAVLITLGSFLLANGLGNINLAIIAFIAAILSLFLTDYWKVFYLEKFIANLAALLVAGYSVMRFFETANEGMAKLSAVGDLLVYLQVVLLFQEKTTRIYWHLWVLSLLQVVVASALSLEFEMCAVLVAYMCLAILTIAFIAIFRDWDLAKNQIRYGRDRLAANLRAPL